MRKDDIYRAHQLLAEEIDRMGEEGTPLGVALDTLFQLLKERGAIAESLNYA